MKNNKMRKGSALRLVLAAAVGLSLFIAMTPTTPNDNDPCSGEEKKGKLAFHNKTAQYINVQVTGPRDFSQELGTQESKTVTTPVGTYTWVATTGTFKRHTESGSATVSENRTTTITITFPGF
ncbi:MAG: hypothetical protein ACOC5U_04495 [Candidatus Aminicenantaceae bacterium]